MVLAVLTFATVIAIVLGAYWAFVLRIEEQVQSSVRRRLKGNVIRQKARLAILKEAQRMSSVDFLERLLRRNEALMSGLQHLINQSGARLTPGLFLLTTAVCVMAVYLIASVFTSWSALAILAAVLAAFIPYGYLRHKRASRLKQIEEQFPDAIDLIARALRAGHAFTTGIGMVSEEIPAPVGPEFQLLYEQQNFGMPVPEALKRFAERVALLDARFFVTAVLTQREAGGNLTEVLDNLASVIRERFRVKRQVRVLSAHGRLTGWVLMCMPPVMAAILFTLSPETTRLLVTDPLGVQMVMVAVILQVIGALVIRKLVDIEY